MTDKPLPEDEPGAQERFDRAIKTALATKPTPHRPKAPSRGASNVSFRRFLELAPWATPSEADAHSQ